jgi:hypothetical protein
MTSLSLPTGPFTCEVGLRRIRAPQFVREEKEGVTYMVARGYEIAYETTLRFTIGAQLPTGRGSSGNSIRELSSVMSTGGPCGSAVTYRGSRRSATPTGA